MQLHEESETYFVGYIFRDTVIGNKVHNILAPHEIFPLYGIHVHEAYYICNSKVLMFTDSQLLLKSTQLALNLLFTSVQSRR